MTTDEPTQVETDASDDGSGRWAFLGSATALVAAVICCLGPLALLSLGVTSAWVGQLSALQAYEPVFWVAAAGFFGVGVYRAYVLGE